MAEIGLKTAADGLSGSVQFGGVNVLTVDAEGISAYNKTPQKTGLYSQTNAVIGGSTTPNVETSTGVAVTIDADGTYDIDFAAAIEIDGATGTGVQGMMAKLFVRRDSDSALIGKALGAFANAERQTSVETVTGGVTISHIGTETYRLWFAPLVNSGAPTITGILANGVHGSIFIRANRRHA